MAKKSKQKVKYFQNEPKRTFTVKKKAFFIIFKEFSLKKIKKKKKNLEVESDFVYTKISHTKIKQYNKI